MNSASFYRRWVLPMSLVLLGGKAALCVSPPIAPTADEIMRRVVARARSSQEDGRLSSYAYTKQVVVQDLDNQGKVTETKEKLFQFRAGIGSLEQIKINGRIADGARLKKEEEHLARQANQLADTKPSQRDDHWEKYLTPDLVARYQFRLRGQQFVNDRPTYVISFQPRSANLPVHQMADHLLNQLAGTVWIDQHEFEIARARISAQSKVTLGGLMDVLGSLRTFRFELERVRLEDGIWFNRRASGDFEGRKLLDNTHVKTRSETSGFCKTSLNR